MSKEKITEFLKKLGKMLLVLLFIVVVLLVVGSLFMKTFKFTLILKTFNYVVQNIVNVSGMSIWLAKAIVLIAMIPFLWAINQAVNFGFLKKGKKEIKRVAHLVIAAYFAVFFMSMYFLGRGTYFGHNRGEALKYFAVTPEGIRFFDSPGFDPKYGIQLKPVKSDMMTKYQRKLLGLKPKRVDQEDPMGIEFFDPITGEPKIWFYINDQGDYELFDGPGIHPTYGLELKPMTANIVQAYKKRLEEQVALKTSEQIKRNEEAREKETISFLNKYLNLSMAHPPGVKAVAILILDKSANQRSDIEEAISPIIRSQKMDAVLGLFRSPFIKEGPFDDIFNGNGGYLKELQVEKCVDYVVLGKVSMVAKDNPSLPDIITIVTDLEVKAFSAQTGGVLNSATLESTGAGFSNEGAEKAAIKLLGEKLRSFLKQCF
jgi:hypothetical protein